MRAVIGALAVFALAALGSDARTASSDTLPGTVAYTANGKLWRIPAGGGEPVELAQLPEGATVRGIEASANARLLVLDLDGVTGWVQMGEGNRRVAVAPCTGAGRPSPDGKALVCPGGPTTTIVQPAVWRARELDLEPDGVQFLGTSKRLAIERNDQIIAVDADAAHDSEVLAPHRPARAFLVSPNGKRAVGVYDGATEDDPSSTYTFRLDGKAAKRKLGEMVTPVAWSPSSRWVLLRTDKLACLARAVGGEYKCWKRYEPRGFSPDSRHVLLYRDGALYTAPIAGVEPARPKRLVDNVDGPATWLK
jgi:hypothetical protein